MRKMMAVLLMFSAANALARSADPAVSVQCRGTDQPIGRFNFDLYATGHPMGGVTMFTGIYEIDDESAANTRVCKSGHIDTLKPRDHHLIFSSKTFCVFEQEIELEVMTDLFHPHVPNDAILRYREILPLGHGEWHQQNLVCEQI